MSEPIEDVLHRLREVARTLRTNERSAVIGFEQLSHDLDALLASWEERGREIERLVKTELAQSLRMNAAEAEVERLKPFERQVMVRYTKADEQIRQAEARLAKVVEALSAVWTFPGVRGLFAAEESLGSVAAQVRAALAAAQPKEPHWICSCNYMNAGPICTHCGRLQPKEESRT